MVLPNLTTNMIYEVKVRAASYSTVNPKQIILGSYSEPKKVSQYNYIRCGQNWFLLISNE